MKHAKVQQRRATLLGRAGRNETLSRMKAQARVSMTWLLALLLVAQTLLFGVCASPSYATEADAHTDGVAVLSEDNAGEVSLSGDLEGESAESGTADAASNAAEDSAADADAAADADNTAADEQDAVDTSDDATETSADTSAESDATLPANDATEEDGIAVASVSDTDVCKIGGTGYVTFKAAIEAAQSGDTIEILKDCSLDEVATIDAKTNVTIKNADGTTPKVTFTGASEIVLTNAATVTIEGVLFDGGSTARDGRAFTVQGGSTLTVNNSTIQNMWSNSNGAAFYVTGSGSVVTFESGTVTGCIASCGTATNVWLGGSVAYIQNYGTFNLKGGTITGNGNSNGPWGCGPFFLNGVSNFNMSGGTITNNRGNHGAAIALHPDVSFNEEGQTDTTEIKATITGGTISNNSTTRQGGAIYMNSDISTSSRGTNTAVLTISGPVQITGNKANDAASAICARGGKVYLGNNDNNEAPTISGNQLTGFKNGYCQSAVGANWDENTDDGQSPNTAGTLYISGNTVIRNNTGYKGDPANLCLHDTGKIVFGDMGVGANIGIRSNLGAGANTEKGVVFATLMSGSTGLNFDTLENDDFTNLVARKTDDDKIVWVIGTTSLKIKYTLPEAAKEDTWFTVQIHEKYKLTNTTEGTTTEFEATVRQSIKVAKGQKTGVANVLLYLDGDVEVTRVEEQSAWRYKDASATFNGKLNVDTNTSNGAGITGGVLDYKFTIGAVTDAGIRTLEVGAGLEHANWLSAVASVINTMVSGN